MRSWIEINLSALSENVTQIRGWISPETEIMAVVKANAYGHGLLPIVRALNQSGVTSFAVTDGEDAVQIKQVLPKVEVLVLGGCRQEERDLFMQHNLTAVLFDPENLVPDIDYHLKIDTGMNRLGVGWKRAAEILRRPNGQIKAVLSHFAASDSDPDFTRVQLDRFLEATKELELPRHIANSAAIHFPGAGLDAVRPGLALYGYGNEASGELTPLLSWKTRLLQFRELDPGASIGYDRTYKTTHLSRIGVLPVGYADGFQRGLSNCGMVRLRGQLAPVVGRVSMDFTTIDVTSIESVSVGDEVTLIEDNSTSEISADSIAKQLGTITYDVLTSLNPKIERIYKHG